MKEENRRIIQMIAVFSLPLKGTREALRVPASLRLDTQIIIEPPSNLAALDASM